LISALSLIISCLLLLLGVFASFCSRAFRCAVKLLTYALSCFFLQALSAEINQVETKRTIERINRTKSWFFEKINKIDKPLARLTRGHRECVQINKIRNKKRDITIETEEIKKKSDLTTKAYIQ